MREEGEHPDRLPNAPAWPCRARHCQKVRLLHVLPCPDPRRITRSPETMDLGPQWPFWLQSALGFAITVLLVAGAWRHARSVRGLAAPVLGLLCWLALATVPGFLEEAYCRAVTVSLPGCDWEYHRAPVEPWKLLQLIVLGGMEHGLRLGAPLAVIGFGAGCVLRRGRAAEGPSSRVEPQGRRPSRDDP